MKRLRKSVCIILLMAILCSILPNTASAYTKKYWWWRDKEMLIEPDSIKDGYIVKDGVLISYEGTDTELVVPEGITAIASWVFQHNDNYKSITLPYSLKKIGPYNFYYCKNLEKVVFEEEVGEIDHDCFYGNDNLRKIIFSGNIEKIGNDCFKGNSNNFGIKCHKGSKAYQYAIKNNIKISKLYGIDYQVEIEPRLSKIVNESNWQKMKGEVLKLFVKVSNCQEDNTSYDAEDSEKMRLQDTKVIVSLPAGMSFTDGTCEKDLEVGTVKIGEEKTVKTDIIISKSAGIFQALPVSVKLYSKDYQKEYYKNLSSYGTNVSGKEAKALQAAVINKKISLDNEIDSTDNSTTVSNWYGSINTISEYFVGSKHYIFYVTGNKELDWQAHVKVLNQKQEVIKSLDFPKITHYEKYGNAIVDNDGNYYLLCGHADKEHKAVNNTRVFAVFKYDNSMNETGRIEYKATDISQDDSSMRKPFEFGDCSIVIDQNQKMLIDCALIMYNGHQRSQSLCIDTRNMTNLDIEAPYCSHSLEQYIFKRPENKVFYVNNVYGYPRGMQVTLFDENQKQLFSEIMFHFGNMESYQNTKASIGGITELKKGYLFLGCSEKELSFSVQKNGLAIERNVFIQLWDKEFYKKDIPEERQLFVTEPRRTTGSYDLSTAFEHSLEQNHTDYGVLWLTNYKGAEYASASKIVKLTDSTVAVFWEKRNYTEKSSDKYVGTYYCIIDEI